MKFILKDKFIHIVNSTGTANHKVVAQVVTNYVDNDTNKIFEYKLNGEDYKRIVNSQITFKPKDYDKGYVDLIIRARKDDEFEYYRADRIPVTFAVVFGDRIDEAYPEVLRHLLARMDRMDVVLTNIIDAMEEVDKKGDLF
jgi:hypothetical protein